MGLYISEIFSMFTIIIDLDYVYDIQISLRNFSVNVSVEFSYNN